MVQLGPESRPPESRLEGWVQEVDSCTELRFRSGEELLKFMGKRFDLAMASGKKLQESNRTAQVPYGKKSSRKERKSS